MCSLMRRIERDNDEQLMAAYVGPMQRHTATGQVMRGRSLPKREKHGSPETQSGGKS